jgi:hypothetical protein
MTNISRRIVFSLAGSFLVTGCKKEDQLDSIESVYWDNVTKYADKLAHEPGRRDLGVNVPIYETEQVFLSRVEATFDAFFSSVEDIGKIEDVNENFKEKLHLYIEERFVEFVRGLISDVSSYGSFYRDYKIVTIEYIAKKIKMFKFKNPENLRCLFQICKATKSIITNETINKSVR